MGRPKKSLEELALSGQLAARPGRFAKRIAEAKANSHAPSAHSAKTSAPIGPAPKWLDSEQKVIWKELGRNYSNIANFSRFEVEIAVKLIHKLRSSPNGLKPIENRQLQDLLDKFKAGTHTDPANNPEPIPVTNPEPLEDTRTEAEKSWDDFVVEDEEYQRREKLIRAEVQRREQTGPPEHLTDTEKALWTWYGTAEEHLFPEVADDPQHKQSKAHMVWVAEQTAKGLSTEYVPKSKQPEPEQVEYTPPPRSAPEPFVEDPAKRLERMRLRWSM